MIIRRFLAYFLAVAGFAVLTTVIFEIYALRRAADHAVEHQMLFAKSVARFVGGVVEQEGSALEELLAGLPQPAGAERLAAPQVRALRAGALDHAGVAVFDARRRVIAADLDAGGLPPPQVLLPALRHAERERRLIATDLWWGRDSGPRVALVVGRGAGAARARRGGRRSWLSASTARTSSVSFGTS